MTTQAPTRALGSMVELHERYDDSLLVKLYWCPLENQIWLSIADARRVINMGEPLLQRIPNEHAMDAFWHPFCYVAATA